MPQNVSTHITKAYTTLMITYTCPHDTTHNINASQDFLVE